jgi:hypothetical protein
MSLGKKVLLYSIRTFFLNVLLVSINRSPPPKVLCLFYGNDFLTGFPPFHSFS